MPRGYISPGGSGFDAKTTPAERRDFFDLRRLAGGIPNKMEWQGKWVSTNNPYDYNDVVRDDDWLMICRLETGCTQKPAPAPIGPELFIYTGPDNTATVSASQLFHGQRYTTSADPFYVTGYRVYTITGNRYEVFQINADGELTSQFPPFTASTTGWVTLPITPVIVAPYTVASFLVSIQEPDPTPDTFVGDWNYFTPNNPSAPASGTALHANNNLSQIWFHKTDNGGGDRSAELLGLDPGDTIDFLGNSYAIQANPADNGTYVALTVAPAAQAAPDGITTFTFETVSPTPITYFNNADWWVANSPLPGGGVIEGLFSITGVGNVVADDDQYGFDLVVQDAYVSTEWEVVAPPPGAGGGGGGGVSEHNELAGVTSDQHHPRAHDHTNPNDGLVDHDDITNVTADQHHPRAHDHTNPGDGFVDHDDITNVTPDQHHPRAHDHTNSDDGFVDHDDITNVTPDQHHAELHDLDSHTDVNAPAPAGLNVLTWSDIDMEWQPRAPLASIGLTAFAYRFDNGLVGPPPSGDIQFNNADPSLVTEIYIHKDDSSNQDNELFLEFLSVGDWCNIGDRSDYQAQHHSYDVSGTPVDNGDWWTIPVTVFENVGVNFSNNQQVNLVLRYTPPPAPFVPAVLDDLDDVDTTTTPPTTGNSLIYDGALWVPGSGGGGGPGDLYALLDGSNQPFTGNVEVDGTLDVAGITTLGDNVEMPDGQLDVTGNSTTPEVRVGTSYSTTYGGIKGDAGYLILTGNGSPNANSSLYLRTNGTGSVNIGGGATNVNRATFNAAGMTLAGWVDADGIDTNYGSAGAPAHSFTSDADTGMYNVSANSLALACGGAWRAWWQGNNVRFLVSGSPRLTSGYYTRVIDTNGRMAYHSSSAKVKKNIEDMDRDRAQDIVSRVRPVWFRPNNANDRDDYSHYGLIAEEVAEVDPRFVQMRPADDCTCVMPVEWEANDDPDDHACELPPDWLDYHTCELQHGGVDYPAMVAPLLSVVQDLTAQVEELKAQVAALTA